MADISLLILSKMQLSINTHLFKITLVPVLRWLMCGENVPNLLEH